MEINQAFEKKQNIPSIDQLKTILEEKDLNVHCKKKENHAQTPFFCIDQRCLQNHQLLDPVCLKCKLEQSHKMPNHSIDSINIFLLTVLNQLEQLQILDSEPKFNTNLYQKLKELNENIQQLSQQLYVVSQFASQAEAEYKTHQQNLQQNPTIQTLINQLIKSQEYQEFLRIKNELLMHLEFNENNEVQIKKNNFSSLEEFEKILVAKYTYIEFCTKIMSQFQFQQIINLTSVEEIQNMYKTLQDKLLNFYFSDNIQKIQNDHSNQITQLQEEIKNLKTFQQQLINETKEEKIKFELLQEQYTQINNQLIKCKSKEGKSDQINSLKSTLIQQQYQKFKFTDKTVTTSHMQIVNELQVKKIGKSGGINSWFFMEVNLLEKPELVYEWKCKILKAQDNFAIYIGLHQQQGFDFSKEDYDDKFFCFCNYDGRIFYAQNSEVQVIDNWKKLVANSLLIMIFNAKTKKFTLKVPENHIIKEFDFAQQLQGTTELSPFFRMYNSNDEIQILDIKITNK